MSTANKTRYEVQKILSDVITEGLNAYIGQDSGFAVMEFGQATFTKGDKLILLKLYSSQRYGYQGRRYKAENGDLKRTEEWIDRQYWQIHILFKKQLQNTLESLQADDIANFIITWFNGKGSEEFRKNGVAIERVRDSSLVVYNDDSDLYQKRAVLTVRLQVPKEITTTEDSMIMATEFDHELHAV